MVYVFQLYYGYFHPRLSVREEFPNLYQISPKDTSLALAMVSLVVHFRWNWVGMVITDEDLGTQFLSEWRGVIKKKHCLFSICGYYPTE